MNTRMSNGLLTASVALTLMAGSFSSGNALAEEFMDEMMNNTGQSEQEICAGMDGRWGQQSWQGVAPAPGVNGPWMGSGRAQGPWDNPHDGMGSWPIHPEVLKNCLAVSKQQLTITLAQEAVWAAYAKSLTEKNDAKAALFNEMGNQVDNNPIERETRRIGAIERKLDLRKAVLQAYKDLFAQLDTFQKGIIAPPQMAPCWH